MTGGAEAASLARRFPWNRRVFFCRSGRKRLRGGGGWSERKSARLRARQLGQTVVSASSRLPRLDNRPDSAYLASVETTGCVRHASYGDEPKLPLARLSAPSVALFASHAPLHSPPPLRRRPNFNVAQPPPPLRLLSTRNSATNSHFRFIAPLHSPPLPPSHFLLHTRPAALDSERDDLV